MDMKAKQLTCIVGFIPSVFHCFFRRGGLRAGTPGCWEHAVRRGSLQADAFMYCAHKHCPLLLLLLLLSMTLQQRLSVLSCPPRLRQLRYLTPHPRHWLSSINPKCLCLISQCDRIPQLSHCLNNNNNGSTEVIETMQAKGAAAKQGKVHGEGMKQLHHGAGMPLPYSK